MPYKDIEQRRAYAREWVANRRAEFMADKSCVDCGSTEKLELDHVDPSLKVSHSIWSWSSDRRAAEIAKCVVRCFRCHKNKHMKFFPHGTVRMYRKGCRCRKCTDAAVEKSRRERIKRRSRIV